MIRIILQFLFTFFLLLPILSSAETIVLKNGSRIETQGTWEQAGVIKYFKDGKICDGIPKKAVERVEKVEQEKKEPIIVTKTRELYLELIEFKDDPKFLRFGFAPKYKYGKWKRRVKTLKNGPDSMSLLKEKGVAVGDLLMLGSEYLGSHGEETKYSTFINKEFRRALDLQ